MQFIVEFLSSKIGFYVTKSGAFRMTGVPLVGNESQPLVWQGSKLGEEHVPCTLPVTSKGCNNRKRSVQMLQVNPIMKFIFYIFLLKTMPGKCCFHIVSVAS